MDAKIAKLRFATDEAKKQLDFAQKLWQTAEDDLKAAKDKYRAMPQEKQETMQMNDTEMPELLETAMRAKQVYEDTKQRYETNLRYVNKFEMLAAGGSAAS